MNRIQKRKGSKKGTDMWKHLKYSYAVIGLIIFFLGGTVSATGDKTTELHRKMAEISSLQHSLSEKITLAMTKKEQLEQKTEALLKEIRDEKEQMQIESYQKAVLVPRIDYNLKLIQLLLGYTYFQQAQDDLLMIKTLNDLEVDKLIAQINSAIDEYTPETTKPLFNVDGVPLKDTEQIWNDIRN
jgi:hypothetical protein